MSSARSRRACPALAFPAPQGPSQRRRPSSSQTALGNSHRTERASERWLPSCSLGTSAGAHAQGRGRCRIAPRKQASAGPQATRSELVRSGRLDPRGHALPAFSSKASLRAAIVVATVAEVGRCVRRDRAGVGLSASTTRASLRRRLIAGIVGAAASMKVGVGTPSWR